MPWILYGYDLGMRSQAANEARHSSEWRSRVVSGVVLQNARVQKFSKVGVVVHRKVNVRDR